MSGNSTELSFVVEGKEIEVLISEPRFFLNPDFKELITAQERLCVIVSY